MTGLTQAMSDEKGEENPRFEFAKYIVVVSEEP